MDRNIEQFVPQQGMAVVGADEEKVGEVDTVEQDYFVVRKGFFFPEDHYIPMSAISNHDDQTIYLNYTKNQVLEQEWTSPPPAGQGTTLAGTEATGRDADLNQVNTSAQPGQNAGYGLDDRDTIDDELGDRGDTDRDTANIPVHEEDLVAKRREVDRGDVQINKNVVEEEESVDIPLTEERVEVTRRDVDRDVRPGENAFEEGTIDVPVHGEEVDVEKRARVTEEIDVDKTAEQHTEHVSDTVRREEVTVDGEEVESEKTANKRGRR